jgi:hypothetical protein
MYRKIGPLLVLSLLFGFSASAQDSKADVYAGFQYTRINSLGSNMYGGVGQVAYYPSSWFGVVGEFSGSTRGPSAGALTTANTLYTYMGGPRLTFRHGPIQPYVQALFGGATINTTTIGFPPASTNAFALAVGGGLDLKIHRHIAFRVLQADYFYTHFGGGTQNNMRFSSGVVFRF